MQSYHITANDAAQRLDKFLKKLFPNASRDLIYKLNRKEKIKVVLCDGKKTKQDNEYKLQVGEIVQVYLSESEIASLQEEKVLSHLTQSQTPHNSPLVRGDGVAKLSKKDIVFEDGSLLLVNKSAGINVHPGDHKTTEVSLIQQVHDYLGEKLNSLTFKPSLVHRIDRDTSGLVMIAKQKDALVKMSTAFQGPSIQLSPKGGKSEQQKALQKTYFALVAGKLSRSEGTIKKALLRKEDAKNENKVIVSEKGQEAVTHYKLLEEFEIKIGEQIQVISAIEVTIETGRMHQIRVHMAHI